jgi:hypothetical protein
MRIQVFEQGERHSLKAISKTAAKQLIASKLYRWLGKGAIGRITEGDCRPFYADGNKLYPLQVDCPEMQVIPAYRYPVQLAPKACSPTFA